MGTVAKPDELLALHGVTAQMFAIMRRWFDVPSSVTLDLTAVDSAVVELGEPRLIAAMAMRKLQALHLLSTPGVRTSTDVVVAIVQDLQRALIQAPTASDDADPEVDEFRALHALLLLAVEAVITASDGEIRYLV